MVRLSVLLHKEQGDEGRGGDERCQAALTPILCWGDGVGTLA